MQVWCAGSARKMVQADSHRPVKRKGVPLLRKRIIRSA
jgi:hypothetical protein